MEECYLKPATLLKVTLLYGRFLCLLNCTIETKSCNAPSLVLKGCKITWNFCQNNENVVKRKIKSG